VQRLVRRFKKTNAMRHDVCACRPLGIGALTSGCVPPPTRMHPSEIQVCALLSL
jgi:hypothetical protein